MKSKAPFKRGELLIYVCGTVGCSRVPRAVKYKSYGGPMRPTYVWVTDVATGNVFGAWLYELTPQVQTH